MVLNSYSSSSVKNQIKLDKNVVAKLGKKEYFLHSINVYPANENEVKKLMKECKAVIHDTEEIDVGKKITFLVPVTSINKLIGVIPFHT